MKKYTWLSLVLALVFALPAYAQQKLDFDEVSRIVIQSDGRQSPLDSFANKSLQLVTGRRTVTDPVTGERLSAMDAMLSIWLGKRDWNKTPLVLISNPQLREECNLNDVNHRRHFSFQELMDNQRMSEYYHTISDKHAAEQELTEMESEAEIVFQRMMVLNQLLSGEGLTIVPHPSDPSQRWATLLTSVEYHEPEAANALMVKFSALSKAYLAEDAAAFTTASRDLRLALRDLAPADLYRSEAAIAREVHYNNLHPFRWAWVCYLVAFLALLWRRTYKFGMVVFYVGLALNFYGFGLRAWIAERAPVTNMYETMILTALAVSLFAVIFEAVYKARIYALCAAPLAVATLIMTDLFPTVLDPNIRPLPPVLRDNFWLVTHVITIMLGYAAFALAMGLGHYILGRYLLKPETIDDKSEVHFLLHRVVQLGVLCLAAGTILGGVWANYSWGRFWGWDPKETWALIALMLYIFAIHAKIAGWWKNFGMAVSACLCFNGVLMAWFGVNFVLGAGLHSYGFGTGGTKWVALAVAIDAVFIGICMLVYAKRKRNMPKADDSAAEATPQTPAFTPPSPQPSVSQ